MHNGRLVMVWSAPNYCDESVNDACVMSVGCDEAVQFVSFEKDPKSCVRRADLVINSFT
jgi:hypothetical protein